MLTSLTLLVLVGSARRWRRAWPAVAGGVLAALVRGRAPWSTRSWWSRCSTPSPRCPTGRCGRRSSSWPTARASRSTTSWSPTPPGAPRRSTRTSPASAAPAGWSSTTTSSTTWGRPRRCPWSATSSAHAKHDDVLIGTALGAAGAVLGVGLLGLLLPRRREEDDGGDDSRERGRPAVRAAAPRAGRGGRPARQSGAERDQPSDRDPGRCRGPALHRRPGGVHRPPAGAGEAVGRGSDSAGLVAVLVRVPPDHAGAHRAGRALGVRTDAGD